MDCDMVDLGTQGTEGVILRRACRGPFKMVLATTAAPAQLSERTLPVIALPASVGDVPIA
jgi:hypothetical protein